MDDDGSIVEEGSMIAEGCLLPNSGAGAKYSLTARMNASLGLSQTSNTDSGRSNSLAVASEHMMDTPDSDAAWPCNVEGATLAPANVRQDRLACHRRSDL